MGPIFDDNDKRRHRLFNGPQHDPTALAKRAGLPHYARRSVTATGARVLMPSDFMPVTEHAGKHLHAVPHEFLRWVDAQPWAATWHDWAPVRDYLQRFPLPEPRIENRELRTVSICVTTIEVHAAAKGLFKDGAARLYAPQDDHQPHLHAFACGAVGLRRDWCRPADATAPPHYLLTPARQELALSMGAELVTRRQQDEHAGHWKRAHGASGTPFVREMPDGSTRCTKHCYASLKDAQTVINERTQGRARYRHGRPDYLRAYLCPQCGFHHLTHVPDRNAGRGEDETGRL